MLFYCHFKRKQNLDSMQTQKERLKNPLFLGRFWGCVEIFTQDRISKFIAGLKISNSLKYVFSSKAFGQSPRVA